MARPAPPEVSVLVVSLATTEPQELPVPRARLANLVLSVHLGRPDVVGRRAGVAGLENQARLARRVCKALPDPLAVVGPKEILGAQGAEADRGKRAARGGAVPLGPPVAQDPAVSPALRVAMV